MKCQSCGRTSSQTYCDDCIDGDGNLKSFDEVVDNLTQYFVETQGFDPSVARSAAIGVLSRQPAWEKKLTKEARKHEVGTRIFLFITAVVFTVVGAGAAYWFGFRNRNESLGKVDDTIRFLNFSSQPQQPFDHIVKTKVDKFDVFEMMCPADQKIVELDGDYLTMKSLEGRESSPDFQLYTFNMQSETGYRFDPQSLETRTQHVDKGTGMIFEKAVGGKKVIWHFNPYKGVLEPVQGYILWQSSKLYAIVHDAFEMKIINKKTGEPAFVCEDSGLQSAVSNNFLMYGDAKVPGITLRGFNGKTLNFPLPKNFSIFERFACNDRYAVSAIPVDDSKPPDKADFKETPIDVYDFETGKKTHLFMGSSFDTSVVMSSGNSPNDTVVCWTEPRLKEGSTKEKPQYTEVRTEGMTWGSSEWRALGLNFVRMSDPTKIIKMPVPKGCEEKSIFPIAATPNYIIWDTYRHGWRSYSDNGWVRGTVAKWGVWVYDIRRNINIHLDDSGCDGVFVDGNVVAWEKYRGVDNDQFYNIKYAQLEKTEE